MSVGSREIFPGIHIIQECAVSSTAKEMSEAPDLHLQDWYVSGRDVHLQLNAYLFVGERSLLFDTLSGLSREQIVEEVRDILGDQRLDYVVISHTDVPHCANAHRLLQAYPYATLVAPGAGATHALFHLENSMKVGFGDTLDLGGHLVEFHEATFLDAAMSHWMFERNSRMLLTVDWLGFPHMDHECLLCLDEFPSRMTVRRLIEHHGRVFLWYQYVDVLKTHAEIDRLIRTHDPAILAPAHGSVIKAEAVKYMEMMKPVVAYIQKEGRLGNF